LGLPSGPKLYSGIIPDIIACIKVPMVKYAIIDYLASCHTRICADEHYKKEIMKRNIKQ